MQISAQNQLLSKLSMFSLWLFSASNAILDIVTILYMTTTRILIAVKSAGMKRCSAATDLRMCKTKSIDLLGIENSTPFFKRPQRTITKIESEENRKN